MYLELIRIGNAKAAPVAAPVIQAAPPPTAQEKSSAMAAALKDGARLGEEKLRDDLMTKARAKEEEQARSSHKTPAALALALDLIDQKYTFGYIRFEHGRSPGAELEASS
jgi:hypothetical protein